VLCAYVEDVTLDAIVVGSGPNGLTAAAVLAQAGLSVRVYEAAQRIGGGARTEELTLPGFRHDPCAAVHPFGAGSPAFRALSLTQHGLQWVHPDVPLAHPLLDGTAAVLARSPEETARSLGADGDKYLRIMRPLLGHWDELAEEVLRAPLAALPHHPLLLARFGLIGAAPAELLALRFKEERTRGLIAGMAGHVIGPLGGLATGGIALFFALAAHSNGWPFARGGSQAISDALAGLLRQSNVEFELGHRVRSLDELPAARAYLLDVSPRELDRIAGPRLSPMYRRGLRRYRYGPAVFKVDYALDGPVPWTSEAARRAGTVHLGPSLPEIRASLRAVSRGHTPPQPPFLLTAQPSLFDDTRAPAGKHTFWAYGHVPNGWRGDFTEAIERQIERFAPGFRDLVLARATRGPAELEADNPNYVGGDIACGRYGGLQSLLRPMVKLNPYATSDPAVYLCSAATPPGPGVHGMSGWHAARSALHRLF
jgi:phytoene dehydrogenase-like protein